MQAPLETSFQIAILAGSPDRLKGLNDVASIDWLYCQQAGASSFHFYRGEQRIASVDLEQPRFGLAGLLGILVEGPADKVEAIETQWRASFPALDFFFRQIAAPDPESILGEALAGIANDLSAQRRFAGGLALELATYRREFDRLQHCFARLEEHIASRSYPQHTEIFEYPPSSMTTGEEATAAGRSLLQYLPVDSIGVATLSIHLGAVPASAAEPLRIKLRAIETGHIYGDWSIATATVSSGWINLALDRGIDEQALSLALIAEWPAEGSAWELTLGSPHPHPEFCARDEGGAFLRSPLALRVFAGLPGVRVTATTDAIRTSGASDVLTRLLPFERYESAKQILPRPQGQAATFVFVDREIGCITVHPRKGELTAARITVVVPKDAWAFSAQIHLAHEGASITEFGLLACSPSDEARELARLPRLDPAGSNFSGWKSLDPLEMKSISLLIAASAEQKISILLLTRQAPEASPDFGWARFSKFHFNILPRAFHGENGSGEWAIPSIAPVASEFDRNTPSQDTSSIELSEMELDTNVTSL
jgi:hypothetical protein